MPAIGSQPTPKKPFSLAPLLADAAALLGLAAFSYGFWLAWRPLGFIVGGLALSALGVLYGRSIAEIRRRS